PGASGCVTPALPDALPMSGTNDVPVASDSAKTTGENAVLASSVPAATDIDGTVASYSLVSGLGAGNGSVVFNNDGTYTFTPGTDFDALAVGASRNVSFTYTATDNDGGVSAAKTVTITVTGTNDVPVAADSAKTTGENAVLSSSVPAATDIDGTVASYALVSGLRSEERRVGKESRGRYALQTWN